jgi:hypothetical protein
MVTVGNVDAENFCTSINKGKRAILIVTSDTYRGAGQA